MARKKFTFEIIEKWEEEGSRGVGEYGGYQPWHKVSRSDPSSRGRSHLTYCPRTGRMRHQLSDGEQTVLSFSLMVPNCIDIKEQFKLERYEHHCALSNYTNNILIIDKGTVEIAKSFNIRHPLVSGIDTEKWVMTTDFVLILSINEKLEILAISYKLQEDLTKRAKEKLKIEQKYWELEHARWLLITDKKFSRLVGDTAKRVLPWVLHPDQCKFQCKNAPDLLGICV